MGSARAPEAPRGSGLAVAMLVTARGLHVART
jgi:hypothetical protein